MSRTEPVPVRSVVGESYAVDRALTGGLAAGTVVSERIVEPRFANAPSVAAPAA